MRSQAVQDCFFIPSNSIPPVEPRHEAHSLLSTRSDDARSGAFLCDGYKSVSIFRNTPWLGTRAPVSCGTCITHGGTEQDGGVTTTCVDHVRVKSFRH